MTAENAASPYDLYSMETLEQLTEKIGTEGAKVLWYDHIEAVATLDRQRLNFCTRSEDLREKLVRAEKEAVEAVNPNDLSAFQGSSRMAGHTDLPETYYADLGAALREVYLTRRAIKAVLGNETVEGKRLVVTYDVSDLTDDEIDTLTGEAFVQAERSKSSYEGDGGGHPAVSVTSQLIGSS